MYRLIALQLQLQPPKYWAIFQYLGSDKVPGAPQLSFIFKIGKYIILIWRGFEREWIIEIQSAVWARSEIWTASLT
jgi:hypothetical protein